LAVTAVSGVVAAAVTQVDPADVGDVAGRVAGVTDHHHFLMMRPAGTDAHVAQTLAARGLDLLTEVPILA
jgi:uncharacterized protein YciW